MESYEDFYSRTLKTLCNTRCNTVSQHQRALCDTHCSTASQQQGALCDTRCSTASQQQRALCDTHCSTASQHQRALCNIHCNTASQQQGALCDTRCSTASQQKGALCDTHCSTASQQKGALCNTHCSTAPQQQRALCNIHFHGRRLLEPVLSEDLRVQVCEDRRRAVERDSRRHTHTLLQRVQDILNNIHLKQTQSESESAVSSTSEPSPSLGSRSVCVCVSTGPGQNQRLSLKRETLRLLNQRMEKLESDASSAGSDPDSPDSTPASLSLSLTGSYAPLPGPQPSRSPDTPRARRPRTHSAGNIVISRPVSESELRASASEHQSEGVCTASPAPSGADRNCSGSESSDGQLSIITSTPSSLRSDVRSGPARRSPPAPLNRSYDVENPSPSLLRPQISVPAQTAVEQQIDALERLEREHTHQISELLAAQERQTQELQRKLKDHSRKTMMSSAPQINTGQDVCVETQPLCRLSAVARGFLTRRLLHTEKITHLRKTIQDSRAFMKQLKTVSVSHQDLTLQQRVTAQLRSALHDVHQIFFMWPLRDRLHLMQQDRERRRERTLREMTTDSAGHTRTLSSATQKTLDRKGQRHAKKLAVIPRSSPARILQSRLSQNTVCSSQSALKNRDGGLGVRQHSLQRKYLSLG